MKTAISIPDELFERADALAEKLGVPRSRLYSDAVAEYLMRHDSVWVTNALDEVVADLEPDAWTSAASRATLERSEW